MPKLQLICTLEQQEQVEVKVTKKVENLPIVHVHYKQKRTQRTRTVGTKPAVAASVDILDGKGEALLVGMHVRLSSGKPRHGKVTKLSPEAVDVQTERGLRTVRPSDVVGVKLHAGRTRARHAVRLKALMQGATQAPRSRKL